MHAVLMVVVVVLVVAVGGFAVQAVLMDEQHILRIGRRGCCLVGDTTMLRARSNYRLREGGAC